MRRRLPGFFGRTAPSRPLARGLLATLAALVALVATVPLAGPQAAAATRPAPSLGRPGPGAAAGIGGPQLAGRGVIVDPLPGAPALPKGISASGWLVADLDTGAVLAARDPHGQFLPASTMKTLTAVTLLPRLDPGKTVAATNADVTVDGTRVGMVPGMRYSVRILFTAMLVVSANDAALGLADAYGGPAKTVAAMNTEARHLQALDTVARNPHGLDAPGQLTSAYDLALIAKAGLAMPDFRHYIGIVQDNFPAPKHKHFQIYTHDRLLVNYRGAIGVKDGYTVHAHASFVGAATRGGHTLVVTLLHANPYCWHEAAELLSWGFAARTKVQPVGQLVDPAQPGATTAGPGAPAAAPVAKAGTTSAAMTAPAVGSHGMTASLAAPVGAAAGVAVAALLVVRGRLRRRPRRPSLPRI